MRLTLVLPALDDEIIATKVKPATAIKEAQDALEMYFDDEIMEAGIELDEDSFYVVDEVDDDSKDIKMVHMVVSSFGDLSDFYVLIEKD